MKKSKAQMQNDSSIYSLYPSCDESVSKEDNEKLSVFRIIGISCALLGYQLSYSCNFSMITPIMGRLGIPNFLKPIIWWAAPITDLVVQPIIAFYSDQSHSKLGRRRPYVITGGLGVVLGFLMIYFCEKIGSLISSGNGKILSQTIFIIAFVVMNIALNILQGPARSLVGDIVPQQQQFVGNTIATIMNGLGAIIVNFIGGMDLSKYTPFSNEQLVFIVGMSSVFVAITITCFCAHETVYKGPKSDKSMLHEVLRSFKEAPTEVTRAATCFGLSWCGFFMFLVETTDFFGRTIFHGCPSQITGDAYERYTNGVNFGMLTIASTYTVSLVYGFVQPKIIDCIGAKLIFAISQFIEVACLVIFNFIKNKWILFGLFSLLGMSFMAFNSVPFAIVGMSVPEQDMGKNMAVVNSFGCVGQQTANILIGSGVAALFPSHYNIQIASGALFSLLAGILTVRLIVPEISIDNRALLEESNIKD